MHALVIEDSPLVLRILRNMLEQLGFEVTESSNGREALDRLHAGLEPDIVLVDWNMPGMNGLEFVKAVRTETQYQNLPLMMVTSETEMAQVAAALAAGANEYVMKPFGTEVMSDKLQLLGF
jgi:two-component system, chemotaxis family, chemotaxis protein CheY